MLKFILLAIIGWYVLRAAGNLIEAIRTDPNRIDSRPGRSGVHVNPQANQGAPRPSGRQPDHGRATAPREAADIEDAHFKDVS